MVCRVTSTAKSGLYRLVTDYFTDPARNTVLHAHQLTPLRPRQATALRAVRRDRERQRRRRAGNGGPTTATIDTTTGHPIAVSSDTSTTTNAANRDYAQPVYAALDGPFSKSRAGSPARPATGSTQLDAAHALTPTYTTASNGNVVQTAQRPPRARAKPTFTLALGFGATQAQAVGAAEGSSAASSTQAAEELRGRLAGVRRGPEGAAEEAPGLSNSR